jgi:hypothetical protein
VTEPALPLRNDQSVLSREHGSAEFQNDLGFVVLREDAHVLAECNDYSISVAVGCMLESSGVLG